MEHIHNREYDIIEECMQGQAVINIALIGHVANGKSTLAKVLTGKTTQQHSKEKLHNMTIKLGYTNGKIYKCIETNNCTNIYKSVGSDVCNEYCDECNSKMKLILHFSLVDCPGHNKFMPIMLSGMSVVDKTIILEAINNKTLPESQTIEHLNATQMANIPNIAICMNKMDLIKKSDRHLLIDILDEFREKIGIDSPIIPISANFGINIDILCEYIAKCEIPKKHLDKPIKIMIVRSFDINKINTRVEDIQGGVIGGSILQGILKIGDKIMIKPGYISKNNTNGWICKPFITSVISLNADNNVLEKAIAGGLIGICTDIDPSFAAKDRLSGSIVTTIDDTEINIYECLLISIDLLKEYSISKKDIIIINIGPTKTKGFVRKIFKNNLYEIDLLDLPVCACIEDKLTISMQNNELQTVIGYGIIKNGISAKII